MWPLKHMNCDNLLYVCRVDVCCMLLKRLSNKEMASCPVCTAMSLQDSLNVSMLLKIYVFCAENTNI